VKLSKIPKILRIKCCVQNRIAHLIQVNLTKIMYDSIFILSSVLHDKLFTEKEKSFWWIIFNFWCLTPRHFLKYFSYIMVTSFSGVISRSTWKEPPTIQALEIIFLNFLLLIAPKRGWHLWFLWASSINVQISVSVGLIQSWNISAISWWPVLVV
jgi:hypothetical protein